MSMTVCGRSGTWTFAMWRVLPNSLLEPLGKRDSETGAADLICQSTDWIADRDASLAVEQAAVNGTKRIGDVLITLEPVGP